MRCAFWGLLVIAAIPVGAAADDQPQIPWGNKFFVAKDPPPVVVHDFGTVPMGTTLTHRFPIANIYAVPMQIVKDPEVSCGCTRIVRYTQKLEPRETGFVDVEMDARRFDGAKAVTIQVRFGPKFQSTAILQVRAFARTDVQINPGQVSFGMVALGQQPAQSVEVQYAGQQMGWQIHAVDATNAPNITAQLHRLPNPRQGVTLYRLTVGLKADAEPGVLQDHLVLKTNDSASPIVTVPIVGTVQAPLSIVQGTSVRLDPIAVGDKTERNIMLRGTRPFRIVKVDGEGDGLTVKYENFASPIQRVSISFKPTQPGELRRKLLITNDQKETAAVTIEGTAEGGAP